MALLALRACSPALACSSADPVRPLCSSLEAKSASAARSMVVQPSGTATEIPLADPPIRLNPSGRGRVFADPPPPLVPPDPHPTSAIRHAAAITYRRMRTPLLKPPLTYF